MARFQWKLFCHGPSRSVHDRALAVTIAQAYGSVLERGRYPRGVVYLDLPPEFLDVNVHPQKAEVRFADTRATTDALYGMLSRALAGAFSLPTPNRSAWSKPKLEAPPSNSTAEVGERLNRAAEPALEQPWATPSPAGTPAVIPLQRDLPRATSEPQQASLASELLFTDPEPLLAAADSAPLPARAHSEVVWSSLNFVAQLRQTFLLCESRDGIYLLDQHAAAERVTFTRVRNTDA